MTCSAEVGSTLGTLKINIWDERLNVKKKSVLTFCSYKIPELFFAGKENQIPIKNCSERAIYEDQNSCYESMPDISPDLTVYLDSQTFR